MIVFSNFELLQPVITYTYRSKIFWTRALKPCLYARYWPETSLCGGRKRGMSLKRESFERATHLLWEIHFRKNIDRKVVCMDIIKVGP